MYLLAKIIRTFNSLINLFTPLNYHLNFFLKIPFHTWGIFEIRGSRKVEAIWRVNARIYSSYLQKSLKCP